VPERVPTIHRWLGLTEAKLGHCADAVVALEQFLASSPPDADSAEAVAVRDQCKLALAARSSVRVETSPPGADVRIDPDDDDPKKPSLGVTPLSLEGIPPGDHLIAVYRAGYKTATRIVTFATGRVTRVELTLVPVAPTQTVAVVTASPVTAPKPVWKRSWFWPTIVGAAVVVGIAVGVGVGVGTQPKSFPTLMFQ
jgi:hypothetical protein